MPVFFRQFVLAIASLFTPLSMASRPPESKIESKVIDVLGMAMASIIYIWQIYCIRFPEKKNNNGVTISN